MHLLHTTNAKRIIYLRLPQRAPTSSADYDKTVRTIWFVLSCMAADLQLYNATKRQTTEPDCMRPMPQDEGEMHLSGCRFINAVSMCPLHKAQQALYDV